MRLRHLRVRVVNTLTTAMREVKKKHGTGSVRLRGNSHDSVAVTKFSSNTLYRYINEYVCRWENCDKQMVTRCGNWLGTLGRLRLCNDLYCGACVLRFYEQFMCFVVVVFFFFEKKLTLLLRFSQRWGWLSVVVHFPLVSQLTCACVHFVLAFASHCVSGWPYDDTVW